MLQRPDPHPSRTQTRLFIVRVLSHLVLGLAHILSRMAEILIWVSFYLALALLGILPIDRVHALAGIFWLVLFVLFLRMGANVIGVHHPPVDRAIETASRLPHRPLQLQRDTLFNDDQQNTHTLWQQARQNAATIMRHVRVATPAPFWTKTDPLALRALVIILLVTGIAFSGDLASQRIVNSIWPWVFTFRPGSTVSIATLEVIPPLYTHLPPVIITPSTPTAPVKLFPGTDIRATSNPSWYGPNILMLGWQKNVLQQNGALATTTLHFTGTPSAHTMSLWRGIRRIITTPVIPARDLPPRVTLSGTPKNKTDGTIDIPITYSDDFGLEQMTLTTSAAREEPPVSNILVRDDTLVMSVSLRGGDTDQKTVINVDLSSSYRAGRAATLKLGFSDHVGQMTALPGIDLTLPQRQFNNPVSQQIAILRDDLINGGFGARDRVASVLQALLEQKALFHHDVVSILSIKVAAERLSHTRYPADLRTVIDLMWQTAVRLEDGGNDYRAALQRLTAARIKLEQLLQDKNTTDAELQNALNAMQQALAQTLETLAQKFQSYQDPNFTKMMDQMGAMNPKTMDMDALGDFMRQLQRSIAAGDRTTAHKMLDQLQRMADQLKNPMTSMPQQMTDLMKIINDLQNLIAKQKILRDQTQAQADKMAIGETINTKKNAGEQDALRLILGTIMTEMGEKLSAIPQNFNAAEGNMRSAHDALNRNLPRVAVPDQDRAITELQKNQQQMGQQLMKHLQGLMMITLPNGATGLTQGGQQGDYNGKNSQNFNVPENSRDHLRQILKSLRDRAGSGQTNREYRDYYERLLKQY